MSGVVSHKKKKGKRDSLKQNMTNLTIKNVLMQKTKTKLDNWVREVSLKFSSSSLGLNFLMVDFLKIWQTTFAVNMFVCLLDVDP